MRYTVEQEGPLWMVGCYDPEDGRCSVLPGFRDRADAERYRDAVERDGLHYIPMQELVRAYPSADVSGRR